MCGLSVSTYTRTSCVPNSGWEVWTRKPPDIYRQPLSSSCCCSIVAFLSFFPSTSPLAPSTSAKMGFFATATKVGLLSLLPAVYSQDTVSYDYDTYGTEAVNECPTQTYMSNTLVQPPEFLINKNETGLEDGLIFIGMDGDSNSGQNWPTIFGQYTRSSNSTCFQQY